MLKLVCFLCLVVLVLSASGLAQPQPSLTGEWECTWRNTTNPHRSCSMRLEQAGTRITGTYSHDFPPPGSYLSEAVAFGSWEGSTFHIQIRGRDGVFGIRDGTVSESGDTLSGTAYTVGGRRTFPFDAARKKP